MNEPTVRAEEGFVRVFGGKPALCAEAPGRVNLIGEHTDYNGGFVLPTVIPQRTAIALQPRTDGLLRVGSEHFPGERLEINLERDPPRHAWSDYLLGAARLLRQRGVPVAGFDAFVASSVPVGSGLSSSAALLIATFRALRTHYEALLTDIELARLSQQVENEFLGAHVGIMDPMASVMGQPDAALFVDTRDLSHELVPLPASVELVVIDSRMSHQHSTGGYNRRRAECEEACRHWNVRELRDVTHAQFEAMDALPDPIHRRARHVITENDRVLAAVAAMRDGDAGRLGDLFLQSHRSQRDDYEVSIPEIDLLVDLAVHTPGIYGARLTGGGFGGSIIALAEKGAGRTAAESIGRRYVEQTGRDAGILVPA